MKMDDGRQHETGRHKVDYYRASHTQWNMMNQHQAAKEPNALVMNKKIMSIIAERDAAIRERNTALAEKNEALSERDDALRQRDEALAQRDTALMERDSALAALQLRSTNNNSSAGLGVQRGTKRSHHNHQNAEAGQQITNAYPITVITSEAAVAAKRKRAPRKKVAEDLNRRAPSDGTKYKTEWGSEEVGLNLIAFDESTMQVPVCSCTGVPRQCYKWGSGGWQSSCCTTHMSVYPLPQVPNKRHARMGGRKMSGSVFTRLLTRLALQGHDLSRPLDLKEYWARHGTNRYITIK